MATQAQTRGVSGRTGFPSSNGQAEETKSREEARLNAPVPGQYVQLKTTLQPGCQLSEYMNMKGRVTRVYGENVGVEFFFGGGASGEVLVPRTALDVVAGGADAAPAPPAPPSAPPPAPPAAPAPPPAPPVMGPGSEKERGRRHRSREEASIGKKKRRRSKGAAPAGPLADTQPARKKRRITHKKKVAKKVTGEKAQAVVKRRAQTSGVRGRAGSFSSTGQAEEVKSRGGRSASACEALNNQGGAWVDMSPGRLGKLQELRQLAMKPLCKIVKLRPGGNGEWPAFVAKRRPERRSIALLRPIRECAYPAQHATSTTLKHSKQAQNKRHRQVLAPCPALNRLT